MVKISITPGKRVLVPYQPTALLFSISPLITVSRKYHYGLNPTKSTGSTQFTSICSVTIQNYVVLKKMDILAVLNIPTIAAPPSHVIQAVMCPAQDYDIGGSCSHVIAICNLSCWFPKSNSMGKLAEKIRSCSGKLLPLSLPSAADPAHVQSAPVFFPGFHHSCVACTSLPPLPT